MKDKNVQIIGDKKEKKKDNNQANKIKLIIKSIQSFLHSSNSLRCINIVTKPPYTHTNENTHTCNVRSRLTEEKERVKYHITPNDERNTSDTSSSFKE